MDPGLLTRLRAPAIHSACGLASIPSMAGTTVKLFCPKAVVFSGASSLVLVVFLTHLITTFFLFLNPSVTNNRVLVRSWKPELWVSKREDHHVKKGRRTN